MGTQACAFGTIKAYHKCRLQKNRSSRPQTLIYFYKPTFTFASDIIFMVELINLFSQFFDFMLI